MVGDVYEYVRFELWILGWFLRGKVITQDYVATLSVGILSLSLQLLTNPLENLIKIRLKDA